MYNSKGCINKIGTKEVKILKLSIINIEIITPFIQINEGFINIEKGLIKNIGYMEDYKYEEGYEKLDYKGYTAIPGLIDTHFHGSSGYDFMDGTEEALEAISLSRIKEGVTGIYPTTVSEGFERTKKAIEAFVNIKKRNFDKGSRLLGIHLEGPYISVNKKGAQNEKYIRGIDFEETKSLIDLSEHTIKMVSFAPELKNADKFTAFLVNNDIRPSMAHTEANFSNIEKCYLQGLRHATHLFNGMSPLHHREIGPVGASLLFDDFYVEIIADKIHLSPIMLKLLTKIKDSQYIILITDAIRAQGLNDGVYELGGQEVIVKDQTARLPNGSLAGSTLYLNQAIKNMKEETELPITKIVAMATYIPAKFMGVDNVYGSIEPGKIADIVIVNDNFEIYKVFKKGEVVFSG